MTVEQIKSAVDAGKRVHWANDGYIVFRDSVGQYLVAWDLYGPRPNYWGLTHRDGVTLNGTPDQFYIKKV